MTATHEVRFDIPASDLAVLDGYCNATGKSRADFIRSLVIDWASGKLHEAIVICYIAYAIAPLGKCYLLPVIQLQSAWVKNRHEWLSKFRQIRAKNNGYTTVSVGIPVNVLMSAIGANLRLSFTPICEAEAA